MQFCLYLLLLLSNIATHQSRSNPSPWYLCCTSPQGPVEGGVHSLLLTGLTSAATLPAAVRLMLRVGSFRADAILGPARPRTAATFAAALPWMWTTLFGSAEEAEVSIAHQPLKTISS